MRAKSVTLALAAGMFLLAGFLPFLAMLARSVTVDGRLSFVYYLNFLNSERQWTLLWHSLSLSLLTTVGSVLLGVTLGVLLEKSDLPFRRLFTILFTVPLVIPPYVTAVSWFHILGRAGYLARLTSPTLGEFTSSFLFGLLGCALVLVSAFLPIVMLLTMAFLRTIHPHLEEAARFVCNWRRVLGRITLPLILPGILLSAILVFLITLGEFGVPTFFRYEVFPVESFTQFSAFLDFRAATASAVPLLLITSGLLGLERAFLREKTYQLRPAPHGGSDREIQLSKARPYIFVGVTFLCLVLVVLPLLALVAQSLSLQAYGEALALGRDSLLRSLLYAAIGASLLTVLGFFLGYLIETRSLPFWRSIDTLTIFLFALPSTIVGIGLIALWNRPSLMFVYGTPVMIVFGYVAQYAALTSRITVSTLGQIPASMEEAAQIAGGRWLRRMGLIIAPLSKRGLIAGWLIAYIFCLRDLGVSILVYPPGYDTLPVRTFTLMANGSAELIAALCMLMIVVTLLPLGLLGMALGWKGASQG